MFAVANSTPVCVNLVFWQVQQVSLAIVILVSVLLGVIFTGTLVFYQRFKDNIKIHTLENKIRKCEEEKVGFQ